MENAKFYFVGGYHLTVCVPAVMALAEEAAKEDKVFILSLSAPFIPQFFKEPLDQTEPYWDYVIGNETEALAWGESHGLKTKDVREIAVYMTDLPKANQKRKRTVVVTQGTEPTVVAIQGEGKAREFKVHEVAKAEICDTTGAGYVTFLSLFHSPYLLLPISFLSLPLFIGAKPPNPHCSLRSVFHT